MSDYLDTLLEGKNKNQLEKLLHKAEDKLLDIPDDPRKYELVMPSDFKQEAEELRKNWGKKVGYLTGIDPIDDLTYGFLPGELFVLSGRAGTGKSLLATNMAVGWAKQGHLVMYLTLELTHEQMTDRLMAIDDDWEELPIAYQKEQWITYKDLEPMLESAVDNGVQVVVIDYLQLLTVDDDNQHRVIGRMLRDIKLFAVRNKLAIVLIAATNRQSTNADQLEMEHLRDSSNIEFFADLIGFLWREQNNYTFKLAKNRSRKWDYEHQTLPIIKMGARFT